MQFHGKLNKAGTTEQVAAALLVGEPDQPPKTLYLARIDSAAVTQVSIQEVIPAIAGGDTRFRLSTGDIFHLPAAADRAPLRAFFPAHARRSASLSRLENVRWRGALLLACLFFGLIIGLRYSIKPVGDLVATLVPENLVERGSAMVLQQLDVLLLEESTLDAATKARIQQDFDVLVTFAPPQFQNTRLHFRRGEKIGPNAFALPGNDIVLLDELVEFADSDEVVLAVLAHELGHVTEQHALRNVMRSAVVAVGISLIVGAEESILEEIVAFGSSLVLAQQSREFEIEADSASAGWMLQMGRDPAALAVFLEKILQDCGSICDGDSLFSSHPSFADRVARLKED